MANTWYLDPANGTDATATPYGWWSVSVTYVSGANPGAGSTMTGNTSLASAITTVAPATWTTGSRTVYFYGKSGTFQSETVTFSNGATGTIAGDLTYCAWQTINNGATAGRLTEGDTVAIKQSPVPTSIGNGTWTSNSRVSGNFPSVITVTGAANNGSGLVRLTVNTSTLATGRIVQVLGVGGTVEANGVWTCTVIDGTHLDLQGSAFVNTWSSGGTQTCQDITTKAVVLATAQTANISNCDTVWTVANTSTVALTAYTTDAKEGQGCASITKTSPANATLYAYKQISSTNYSSYQNISFWIKNVTAAITAGQWSICLCSDTAGLTVVDTFAISAIPSVGQWVPLNIARTGGGNMGATIQSVALYCTAASVATNTLLLDNIIACTSSGLNLQSLISTNPNTQMSVSNYEGWYGIQSINLSGKILLLDNLNNTICNAGRGYFGTTQTATTYKRETFKSPMAATSTTYTQTIQKSGLLGSLVYFEGGYDPATNLQTGETHFDGLNGFGAGLYNTYATPANYTSTNWIGYCRYNAAFLTSGAYSLTFNNIPNICNCNYGLWFANTSNVQINIVWNANNSASPIIYYPACPNCNINTIYNSNNNTSVAMSFFETSNDTVGTIVCANNNSTGGVQFYTSSNCSVGSLSTKYNSFYGLTGTCSGNCTVTNLVTDYNGYYGIANGSGAVTVINYSSGAHDGARYGGGTMFAGGSAFVENNQGVANSRYFYTDNGYGTGNVAATGKWVLYPTGSVRTSSYPLPLPIATIECLANQPVSISALLTLSSGTDIVGALVCPGGQIAGVPNNVTASLTGTTTPTEVTITFTPTASGPVTIYFESWLSSVTTNNVTLSGIFSISRVYGNVFLENTISTVDFGQNVIIPLNTATTNPYITVTNSATVAAYTDFTINHATNTITLNANTTTARMYDYTQYNLTQNPSKATWFTTSDGQNFVSSYNINLNGYALTGGTSINVGTNSFTLGGGTYSGLQIVNGVTSNIIQLTGLSGHTVYLTNGAGTQQDYRASVTGTYTFYPAIGTTDTYHYKVAKYGSLSTSGTFSLTTSGGILSANISLATDTGITQATVATVAAYTALENFDKLYDYAAYYETTNTGIPVSRLVNKAGTGLNLGSVNLTVDETAGSVFSYSTGTLTIKATTFADGSTFNGQLVTSGTFSLAHGATTTCFYQDATNTSTILNLSGIVASSNVSVYNLTTASSLYNSLLAGTSLSYWFTYPTSTPPSLRIRVRKAGYETYEYPSLTMSSTASNLTVLQTVDSIYVANGIDGSTVSELYLSGSTLLVYISAGSNTTTGQRLYNGYMYQISSLTYIDQQPNDITAQTSWSYVLADAIQIYNAGASPLYISGANINNVSSNGQVIDVAGGEININGYFPFNSANDVAVDVRTEMDANSTKLKIIEGLSAAAASK